jgi:hypothetical protein
MMTHVRRLLTGCCLTVATLAHAHPGHDGHELTWEMRHLAQHPFATIGCAAIVGAAVAVAIELVRRRTETRVQSLRGSQPTRGK